MSDTLYKCVVLLSDKSSGSSAIQNHLTRHAGARHVERTRHFENETLYWTKAASVLGLPQVDMLESEVPIPAAKARRDLEQLLTQNLPGFACPDDDETLVYEGWRALCHHFGPVFLEKSPHHLHQWSAIELILSCRERMPEVDFLLVGLVRNPLDTLYSMWTRWRALPDAQQHDWVRAYRNLLRLRDEQPERLVVVRYEDVIADPAALAPVFAFVGRPPPERTGDLHGRSVQRWRADTSFGFQLAAEAREVALAFGYDAASLDNPRRGLWPWTARARKALYHVDEALRVVPRRLRDRWRARSS